VASLELVGREGERGAACGRAAGIDAQSCGDVEVLL
jgi:hypothetical protein